MSPVTNTLPSHTTGVEQARPSSLVFHMRSPEKLAGPFRSATTPLPCGPLQEGQFSAHAPAPAQNIPSKRTTRTFMSLLEQGTLSVLNNNRHRLLLITNKR